MQVHAQQASAEGARLVCFPECFLQGLSDRGTAVIDPAGNVIAQVSIERANRKAV
jgi:predicted amidohydrolase